MYKYLIVGGGIVAGHAAQQMARLGVRPGELAIISADSELPYHRPHLSKQAFLSGKMHADKMLINPPEFYAAHGIDVRLNTLVTEADVTKRTVVADGEKLAYEKLLIATGCSARPLTIPGNTLPGVCYLRSLDDARQLRALASQAKRAVAIGAGFIGMEVASVLASLGIDTSIAYFEDRVMANLFTPELSAFFEGYYRARGVKLFPRTAVTELAGKNHVAAVIAASGQSLPTDLVVAGIGAVPATAVFEGSALQFDRRTIVVNEYLETNVMGTYAAGDVTSYQDVIFERQRHVEHWDTAVAQGKHAAGVLTGIHEPYRRVSYFFSRMFDLSWEFWGDTRDADQVVNRGSVVEGRSSTWWLRQERVIAALIMRRPADERRAAPRLIQSHAQVSPARLADATYPVDQAVVVA